MFRPRQDRAGIQLSGDNAQAILVCLCREVINATQQLT